jgi:C_GCAxxG_C_C family probable redox protein
MRLQDGVQLARSTFLTHDNLHGCAETAFIVLKHMYDLPHPEDASPAMVLNGGFAWSGEICGALSGASLGVGMLTERRIPDHKKAKRVARWLLTRVMDDFRTTFGSTHCIDLIQMDIRKPDLHALFIESGVWREVCMRQIEFVIGKLVPLCNKHAWETALQQFESGS